MKTLWKSVLGAAVLALLFLAVPAVAEDAEPENTGVPAYSVTRLKIFEGSVFVRTPDSGDWEEYFHNSPLAERSRISVPEGSEAELQFHGGQFVLLTGGTEMDIRGMGDAGAEFHLRTGEIRFYLPDTDFSPVRLSIPDEGKIDFPVPGKYWVTAAAGNQSRLVVRSGEATLRRKGGEFPVGAGEEASIGREVMIGKYTGKEDDGYKEPPPLTEEEEAAKVPPAAAYELREYGEWVQTPEYGYVWRPRVGPGWSPYYYGRWDWVSPYGWTWIADEPWGWYPYHYGYWTNHFSFGWVWYPFHPFLSFGVVLGHHHIHSVHHFHRGAFFHLSNARFRLDGRNVRWVPLRPGERNTGVRFTRADKRIARWDRTLAEGQVFVRGQGERGREWRDVTVVRGERQRAGEALAGNRRGNGGNSGRDRIARDVRSRGTRPGGDEGPVPSGVRTERPSRGSGAAGSRSGRGSFSQIERGEAPVWRDGRRGSAGRTAREPNGSAGRISRPGERSRGNAVGRGPTGWSGGVPTGRSIGRSGSVSIPGGARMGRTDIRRTGGRGGRVNSLGGRGGGRIQNQPAGGRMDSGLGRSGGFDRGGGRGGGFGRGRR